MSRKEEIEKELEKLALKINQLNTKLNQGNKNAINKINISESDYKKLTEELEIVNKRILIIDYILS